MIRSFLAALLLPAMATAGDWPQFRGPSGQGHVVGDKVPTEFSPDKARWKVALPGSGWSSPSVVAGRVYLTAAVKDEDAHSLRALCLQARDGKKVWDVEVFKQGAGAFRPHHKNSHASPTPVVAGNRLYVHFGHQGTACLDLDGKVLWRDVQKFPPVHGNGGSPALVDGLLIFSCDGARAPYVVALDAKTGKEKWKSLRPETNAEQFAFSTPLVIEVKGKQQLIIPAAGQVQALEPKTGKEIWRVKYPGGYSVIPRPVYGHGLVYVCTGYNSPVLLAIKPDGAGDVTETHVAWRERRGVPHTASPLLAGDELYLVSDAGFASCLDAKTGKNHWTRRLGGEYSASPILADGKIYFLSEEGVCTVVKADTKFEEVATNKMEERTLASFAVADGALFVRTDKHLFRFEAK